MRMKWIVPKAVVTVAALSLLLAACAKSTGTAAGTSSAATAPTTTEPTTAASTTPSAAGTLVDVKVGETDVMHQYMTITPGTVAAGTVTFSVTNEGVKKHEFVILDTDTPTAKLKMNGNEVDEEAYKAVDEIEDIAPGATETLTVDLKAGHYAMICNLKGHFNMGMWSDFNVS